MTRALSETLLRNSSVSRVFPIPGTPRTVTRCALRSSSARVQATSIALSSEALPTNGVSRLARTPGISVESTASHARTGSLLPLTVSGSTGSYAITVRVDR